MNYIDNESFLNNELIPLIDSQISMYLEEEIKFVESSSELEDMMYDNCPDDLKNDILSEVSELIDSCIDDYDIIEQEDEEYEDNLSTLIDTEFEKCKNDILSLELESVEKDYFFDEYDEPEY